MNEHMPWHGPTQIASKLFGETESVLPRVNERRKRGREASYLTVMSMPGSVFSVSPSDRSSRSLFSLAFVICERFALTRTGASAHLSSYLANDVGFLRPGYNSALPAFPTTPQIKG